MKKLMGVLVFVIAFSCLNAQTTAKEWLDKAIELKNEGNCEKAIVAYKKAIALKETTGEAWYGLGWCYNETEKYADATVALAKANGMMPKTAKVLFEMGYTSDKLNKPDEAKKYYKESLTIYPEYYEAAVNLAVLYENSEDYETALKYYRTGLVESKSADASYFDAAWCAAELKKYEEALEFLEKYDPENETNKIKKYNETGYCLVELDRATEAIDYYKKSLNIKPTNGSALRGLARIYDDQESYDAAIIYYEQALEYDEANSHSCYYDLGWIYNEKEDYDKALLNMKKAVEFDADNPRVYEELGFIYYMKSNSSEALKQLDKAISLDPKSKLGYYYKGLVYIDLKQKQSAMLIYEKLKAFNEDQAKKLLEKINAM